MPNDRTARRISALRPLAQIVLAAVSMGAAMIAAKKKSAVPPVAKGRRTGRRT